MKKVAAFVSVAMLVASPAAAAVELVVNGGFELPALTASSSIVIAGGDSFDGWSVLGPGTNVGLIHQAYSEDTLIFNANSGANAIDLTGAGNTGSAAGISQTVATGTGTYRLSFFVGNAAASGGNAFAYTQPSTVNVSINGGPAQAFSNSDETPFGVNWRKFSVVFVATAPTAIAFTNGTVGDNYLGLDDVSVTAVPEPSNWAMLIAGFGLTGAVLRRRRALASA